MSRSDVQPTTAISYLRVSSAGQVDGDGFDRQRAAIEERAKLLGLTMVDEYRDEGVSGTKMLADRPGLAGAMDRIASNGVRAVIVEKADRLSRDLIVSETILREFRALGVQVIEAEDGRDLTAGDQDNATAKLIRQVLAVVSEFEKDAIVSKLRAARRRKRAAGFRVDGRKPYGPEVVETIRKLRRRRVKGKPWSYLRIAEELTALGIPTRGGKPWTAGVVHRILKGSTELPRRLDPATTV